MKTRIDIKILGAESASMKAALATYLASLGYALQCGADTITALKKQETEVPVVQETKKTFGKK